MTISCYCSVICKKTPHCFQYTRVRSDLQNYFVSTKLLPVYIFSTPVDYNGLTVTSPSPWRWWLFAYFPRAYFSLEKSGWERNSVFWVVSVQVWNVNVIQYRKRAKFFFYRYKITWILCTQAVRQQWFIDIYVCVCA